ncbi:MAG: carboxypeptidase-like regulatory domain-containing protein, partial [Prevotella sp.]
LYSDIFPRPPEKSSDPLLPLFAMLFTAISSEAQTVRGTVTDADNNEPVIGASIKVKETETGVISDIDGKYTINNLPTGRYTIEVTYIGYEPAIFREILVTEGKDVLLNVSIRECSTELGEVVVKPRVNKEAAVNKMALVSVHEC